VYFSLPPADLTDDQIKALILNFLLRRRLWGGKYYTAQKMVRYIGQDVLGDDKKVRRCLNELVKDRWINPRKKGNTISLNPSYTKEIPEFIDKHLIA